MLEFPLDFVYCIIGSITLNGAERRRIRLKVKFGNFTFIKCDLILVDHPFLLQSFMLENKTYI